MDAEKAAVNGPESLSYMILGRFDKSNVAYKVKRPCEVMRCHNCLHRVGQEREVART